jgi:hypothetical protein
MSNTGHKGISAGRDKRSRVERYQVFVGWKGKEMRGTIWTDDLGAALALRADFEHVLKKPRTEVRILPAEGITRDARPRVAGSAVWRAFIGEGGKRRSTQFSIAKHGELGARQKAIAWRREALSALLQR